MHVIAVITANACNHKSFDKFRWSFVIQASSCKFPASSMEYHTHACNASSATSSMQSRVCACRVAVSAAWGVAPPCRARVASTRTDSQRLAARRCGPKGAFRGTCARSGDVPRHAKSRVAVSSERGGHAQLNPSSVRGRTDSHAGLISRGGSSQGGRAILLNSSITKKRDSC